MVYIQGLWVLLTIVFFFFRLRIGLCLYVAYIFMVPYMNIRLGVNLQWNFVNMLLLGAFVKDFLKQKKVKFNLGVLLPFFVLYLFLFFEIPFQEDVPLGYSLNEFRISAMGTLILPMVLWNVARYDEHLVSNLRMTVLLCIIFIMGYGLFIAYLGGGVNPYLLLVQTVNGVEFNESYIQVSGGRLFGRISSVFAHPMTYGMFLSLSVVYMFSIKKKLSKWKIWSLMIMGVVSVLLCGIRTPIGTLMVSFALYLLLNMRIKLLIQCSVFVLSIILFICLIPDLDSYVGSIFVSNSNDVSGSSIEMRFEQLGGCFTEISNSPIFGKGYSWANYYHSLKGDHPVILAFESLLFVVLCNNGFLGLVVWTIVFGKVILKSFKLRVPREESIMLCILTITYLVYSLITGEYGYMKYYLIFFTLMMLEAREYGKTTKKNEESKGSSILPSPVSSV